MGTKFLGNYLVFCLVFGLTLKVQSEVQSQLQMSGVSFISPDYDSTSQKTFSFMGARLTSNPLDPNWYMLDLDAAFVPGNSVLSYQNVREIYLTINTDPTSKIYFGRRLFNWSYLDNQWHLGFYQPRFGWNTLDLQNQGLAGLFWENKKGPWVITLFATHLFIPDQGPGFELKDGKFQNSSPWFPPPPQGVRFSGGQIRPIDYNIEMPATSDIIFQSLYAAQLQYGESQGFYAQLAGAFKPSHQLAMAYKNVYLSTRVSTDVLPKTYLETIYSGDFGYRNQTQNYLFSFLVTDPQQPDYDSTYNYPIIKKSISYGPTVEWTAGVWQHSLSYLNTDGGEVIEVGPDASSDRQSLTQRFLFKEAIQFQLKYQGFLTRQMRLESLLQYRQGFKEPFQQIRFKNSIDFQGPWKLWLDFILVETSEEHITPMEPNRNLDQAWIGVSYDL